MRSRPLLVLDSQQSRRALHPPQSSLTHRRTYRRCRTRKRLCHAAVRSPTRPRTCRRRRTSTHLCRAARFFATRRCRRCRECHARGLVRYGSSLLAVVWGVGSNGTFEERGDKVRRGEHRAAARRGAAGPALGRVTLPRWATLPTQRPLEPTMPEMMLLPASASPLFAVLIRVHA